MKTTLHVNTNDGERLHAEIILNDDSGAIAILERRNIHNVLNNSEAEMNKCLKHLTKCYNSEIPPSYLGITFDAYIKL